MRDPLGASANSLATEQDPTGGLYLTADHVSIAGGTKQYVVRHADGALGVHSHRLLRERNLLDLIVYTSPHGEDN